MTPPSILGQVSIGVSAGHTTLDSSAPNLRKSASRTESTGRPTFCLQAKQASVEFFQTLESFVHRAKTVGELVCLQVVIGIHIRSRRSCFGAWLATHIGVFWRDRAGGGNSAADRIEVMAVLFACGWGRCVCQTRFAQREPQKNAGCLPTASAPDFDDRHIMLRSGAIYIPVTRSL